MGNLVHWAEDKAIIKQKPTFFRWNEIKEVKILLKSYRQGIYTGRDFYHAHLRSKYNKATYDCLVHDPRGFVHVLEKLGKGNLIDKSKEGSK